MIYKLGDLYTIKSGGTPSKSKKEYYENGDIPWVRTGDLKSQYLEKVDGFITKEGLENSSAKLFPKKTVLIAMYGATIGATSILDFEAATNQACAAFLPSEKVLPEYLYYYFLANREYIINLGVGGAQPNISATILKELKINVPSIKEQSEIVEILNLASKLAKNRKEQIEEMDELVKSRFVEMFGDPVSNTYELPEATLLELGELGRGVSKHRPRNDPKLLGGDYPLIQTGDVALSNLYITSYNSTYSELGLNQSKIWDKGTLCITIAANIAKTAILNFDACFPDSIVGFTANDKTNNVFIHYWFSFFQAILESRAPESAQKNINLKILSELKVIVPDKDKQDEFADFVKQVDKLKFTLQQSLTELETQFQALMQKAFKGELFPEE